MRETRRKSLIKEFEKQNEKKAFDKYEKALFDFLVDLGELYDENFEHLRVLNINLSREGELAEADQIKKHKQMKRKQHFYAGREHHLNKIGKSVREALCIHLYDPNPEEKAND